MFSQAELFEVRTENEYLKGTNNSLVGDNEKLTAQVAQLKTQLTGSETQVGKAQADLAALKAKAIKDLEELRDLAIAKLSTY